MAARRHWRIHITAGFSSTFLTLARIEFRTTPGGANVATGGTASASSNFSGQPAANAFDGNSSTSWTSADSSKPQWIAYDLGVGVEHAIQEAWLQGLATFQGRMPQAMSIQSSSDGTTWKTVRTFSAIPAWSSGEARAFAALIPLDGPLALDDVDELAQPRTLQLESGGALQLEGWSHE